VEKEQPTSLQMLSGWRVQQELVRTWRWWRALDYNLGSVTNRNHFSILIHRVSFKPVSRRAGCGGSKRDMATASQMVRVQLVCINVASS